MSSIPNTCPSCFGRIQPDAVFCSLCGSEVRREGRVSASQDGPEAAPRDQGIGRTPGEGLPLDHLLRTHGALAIPQMESILQQVGQALAHMHDAPRGLVHGNVRPETIRVEEGGKAILADPGTPPGDHWDGADVSTGLVLENTEYMSPEECRGLAPTFSSDQYALGAVAYAMLAGRPPFVGAFYRVLVAHLSERFVPLLQARPDCPPRLASAVERMLSKDPAERWRDVTEAVQAALSGPGVSEALAAVVDSERAESHAPEEQAVGPIGGRRSGKDALPGVLAPGPDLGPPPASAIEVEEEDVEEEKDLGEDDRTLFFEPTSPPPDQEGWPDEPLEDHPMEEEAGMSLVPVGLAHAPAAPAHAPAAPAHAPAPLALPPATPAGGALTPSGRSLPPRPPPRPRRRRRNRVLLLLILAGVGWGMWEWFGPPAGFEEWPVAQAPVDPGQRGGREPGPDNQGGMLLPAPERGMETMRPRPEPGMGIRTDGTEPIPSGDPSPAAQVESPPSSPGETTGPPPPETPATPSAEPTTQPAPPRPPPAQPTPPSPTRPAPQEPAPAAQGSLEMNIRPWAHLLVNGVPRGRFQTRIALELPAGTHFVRMSNPNFPPFDTTVVVQGGETTVLNKVLQPDTER